jgi:hypothetical protein
MRAIINVVTLLCLSLHVSGIVKCVQLCCYQISYAVRFGGDGEYGGGGGTRRRRRLKLAQDYIRSRQLFC